MNELLLVLNPSVLHQVANQAHTDKGEKKWVQLATLPRMRLQVVCIPNTKKPL